MTIVISVIGFAIIAVCAWGFAAPRSMMDVVSRFLDRTWSIYMAIAGRLALGMVFILGANATRYPEVITILGYLMIIVAALIAVMGRARLKKLINWWLESSLTAARAWLILGVAFGVFLVHAAS